MNGSDNEPLIAKFRLILKKVGKTTRPFRYDLNQIPYDYTVEVRNRFKGLDLIERLMNYGQRFVTLYSIQESRPSPRKKVRQWTWVHHELVIDREAWHASVHGVAKSWTWLRDWTEWSTDWLTDMYQAPHPGWLSGKKKNPPAKQETQVRSLGQEDPWEMEMATHSNILAWKNPWIEEPGEL